MSPLALVPLTLTVPPVVASAPVATTYSYVPAVVEIAPLPLPLPSPYDEVLVVLSVAPCIWITSSKSPLAIATPASPAACAATVIDVAPTEALAEPLQYVLTTPLIVPDPSRPGVAHSAAA